MTLNVPLTVRVGSTHITREVSGVGFRKEAVGGVRSIRLRLARPLNRVDQVTALSKVYLYDARSAETIAEGRISDLGRGVSTDGQQWDLIAFGPAQHASDRPLPIIYFDQPDNKQWRRTDPKSSANVYYYDQAIDDYAVAVRPVEGQTVQTTWSCELRYKGLQRAGMQLGRVKVAWGSLITDANWRFALFTHNGVGAGTVAASATANTAGGTLSAVVVTNFPDGDDVIGLLTDRLTTSKTAVENDLFKWFDFWIRAKLYNADGTVRTTGYTNDYVLAHEVVNDLLGRGCLDQFDGASASVDTTGAHHVDQWAYPDGATPEQMLEDLMMLEPAFYWTTGPSGSSGKYSFAWKMWPTTVRYEVTMEDGGSFPASAQELYNRVLVRWQGQNGQSHTVIRTGACPALDDAGITRQAIIDIGDEIGSTAAATRVGDNFLADHKYPANAGTLTVSRPIRDLTTGRLVEPFEIEPGELIRVLGVESYPDALNASSNDGQTVFRIWSMEYDSDSASATLELDTYSRTTANAIARLIKRRNRKR
jgi:hypothetical protein